MTCVAMPRARFALVMAVGLALLGGAVGCDSGDDIEGHEEGAPSGRATDSPAVVTVMSIQHGKGMDAAHRKKVIDGVTGVIDPWFEGAFLGEFPRSDFDTAFSAFTEDAAADAQRDIDILSNAGIAEQIETATATNRRVRLDVFAPEGRPRGVTANFVLDFETTGDLEERLRVHGALYLAKDKGEWKVFGYDVDQAVPL
jgi:hypothetical protein